MQAASDAVASSFLSFYGKRSVAVRDTGDRRGIFRRHVPAWKRPVLCLRASGLSGRAYLLHALHTVSLLESSRYTRLAAFFRDIAWTAESSGNKEDTAGEKLTASILRRMKFDNDTVRTVSRLVRFHSCGPYDDEISVRRAIYRMGKDLFPAWEKIEEASTLAYGNDEDEKRISA